jgi:hypothetical protein
LPHETRRPSENEAVTRGKVAGTASFTMTFHMW